MMAARGCEEMERQRVSEYLTALPLRELLLLFFLKVMVSDLFTMNAPKH